MRVPAPTADPSRQRAEAVAAVVSGIVVVIVIAVIVLKLRSSSAQKLTGDWQAQNGPVTVNLHLAGSGDNLSGNLTTKNSPVPISGTVDAQVHGKNADVTVRALGQTLKASCAVSSNQLVCTGSGGNQTLTLTFNRP